VGGKEVYVITLVYRTIPIKNSVISPQLAETWYHVASWLLFAVQKHGKRRCGDLSKALEGIATNASTNKEEVTRLSNLPTGRIVWMNDRHCVFAHHSALVNLGSFLLEKTSISYSFEPT
jgi:hypothetical protein